MWFFHIAFSTKNLINYNSTIQAWVHWLWVMNVVLKDRIVNLQPNQPPTQQVGKNCSFASLRFFTGVEP